MSTRRGGFSPVWAAALILFLFGSVFSAYAKTKLEKQESKEVKQEAKQEKEYATINEYAQDMYATDPAFRDEVDHAYQDLQRQHALLAYHVNTSETVALVNTDIGGFGLEPVLYNDPRVQNYVNRIGQGLVPADSDRLYTFRIIKSPVPSARALSTGTIYISTGLLSLTDNEAQLGYILSHELAHVYKDHWKTKVMIERAVPRYEAHQMKKRAMTGALIGVAAGAALGGAAGQSAMAATQGMAMGAALGTTAGLAFSSLEARKLNVDWTLPQEDEADAFALKNALEHNYDVNEVPKLYAVLKTTVHSDSRVSLGFVADGRRIETRTKYVNDQLATTFKDDYAKKLKAEQLVGTSPDYQLMMAQLKRDNGILAMQFDMLEMASKNLHQAVRLRSDDAVALYYEGKIDQLTARTAAQRQEAEDATLRAIKLDESRHLLPEIQLQEALLLMEKSDPASQTAAAEALKTYIFRYYAKRMANARLYGDLPENMVILYDYLRLLGEPRWKPEIPELDRVMDVELGTGETTSAPAPVAQTVAPGASTVSPAPSAAKPVASSPHIKR